METRPLTDHVGCLQDSFQDLLNTMFTTISSIQRDAAIPLQPNDLNQLKFEQLPILADTIVKKVKQIDVLIDVANEETLIGKDIEEIKNSLEKQKQEYQSEVVALSSNCEVAEKWLTKIRSMLDVIAANTPWMQQ